MFQIQKQPMMRRVIYALLPVCFFSFYLYGWRAISVLVVSIVFGYLSEYLMERVLKKSREVKVTESFLVTSLLFALSLPPGVGEWKNLWVVIVGIVFAIVFAKMAYGGFGRNIFNPAMAGRLFVYLAFPQILTSGWLLGGNFGKVDALASVTPMGPLKAGFPTAMSLGLGQESSVALNLFLGTRAGCLGESSILLIILGAIYLVWTKTAQFRLIASPLVGAYLTSFALYYLPLWFGYMPLGKDLDPFYGLIAGGLVFASVFMVSEPVSAPKKPWGQIIYGFLIGVLVVVIRLFSQLPESVSFALIIGNMFACLIDELLPKPDLKSKKPAWTIGVLSFLSLFIFFIYSPWLLGNDVDKVSKSETIARKKEVLKVMGLRDIRDSSVEKLYKDLNISYYHNNDQGDLELLGTNKTLQTIPELCNLAFYESNLLSQPVYGITFTCNVGDWGFLSGMVSLDSDLSKTVGFHVFSHAEKVKARGLKSEAFEEQFANGIELVNGTVVLVSEIDSTRPGEIQAIAGATTTSSTLSKQLAKSFAQIRKLVGHDKS